MDECYRMFINVFVCFSLWLLHMFHLYTPSALEVRLRSAETQLEQLERSTAGNATITYITITFLTIIIVITIILITIITSSSSPSPLSPSS